MRITYDRYGRSVYIQVREDIPVFRTRSFDETTNILVSKGEQVIGIELLGVEEEPKLVTS